MVRYEDAISSVLQGHEGVLVAHYSLGEDWQLRELLDVGDYRPVDIVVFVQLDVLGQRRLLLRTHLAGFAPRLVLG